MFKKLFDFMMYLVILIGFLILLFLCGIGFTSFLAWLDKIPV